MGEATIQNLTNDAMYQAKQFRKRKQQTRDFINRKNYFPPKHMTISHPRMLKKIPKTCYNNLPRPSLQ